MRAFAVLLLLLNVLVLAVWTLPSAGPPEPYPPDPEPGSLELVDEEAQLRERESPESADDSGEDGRQADPSAAQADGGNRTPERCSVRTLASSDEAEALVERLRAAGNRADTGTVSDEEWVGHWVHVPEQESMEAAQAIMDRLAEAGIEDYGYVGGGGHAISLGVYSRRERAERRRKDLEDMGFEVTIADRYRNVTRHRVVAAASPDSLPESDDWETSTDCAVTDS